MNEIRSKIFFPDNFKTADESFNEWIEEKEESGIEIIIKKFKYHAKRIYILYKEQKI